MKTATETIYSWNKMDDEKVIKEITKSILEFRKIGLELDQINLEFAEAKNTCASDCLGEQTEKHDK